MENKRRGGITADESAHPHVPFAERDSLLAAIVESSDDAIIAKDLDGIIRSWNTGAEKIFGYTPDEAIGKSIKILAPPEHREEISDILARIRRGERVDHYETKRRTKDGRILNISLTVSPVRNSLGEIIGASKIARDVTERKRLEIALLEQTRHLASRERYLQAIMESMPECIKVLGPGGELRVMNAAGLRMIEAEGLEQVRGICVYPLIDEEQREAFREVNENAFGGGPGGTLEFGITGLKGTRRILETRVVPLRNEDNLVVGALSATRDITNRRLADEALLASEARFRAAASTVSSLIWTNNSQGQMQGEQPGWAAFTGQSFQEYQGYGWASAVHPDDAQPTIDAWNEAVTDGCRFSFEHRVRRRDGVYRLFTVRAVPLFTSTGKIREWVGVHTDITEERQLIEERALALNREQQARQTAEILNQVGSVLAAELDSQVLTQTVTDLATRLVNAEFGALFHNVVDDRGERYLLYTISGVAREHFAQFPMPRNTKIFAPTFSGEGIVRSDDITQDPRYGQNAPHFGMPSGHLPVRSYLAAPVISRSGQVLGGLFFGHGQVGKFTKQHEELLSGIAAQTAIALDNAILFSESQRARAALARSNEDLRRANADLEQFAYSASHDLREPLRQVAVYSQLLQRRYKGKLDDDADEFLSLSVEGAHRMEALVSGLLAYTQAGTLEDHDDISPVDVSGVLENALANLRDSIRETDAVVEVDPLPMLRVQDVHLLQLFQNLLGNALKYRGPKPPRIRVSAQPEGSLWRLCVHDNGVGIDPAYAEQIFGLFKRLHTTDQFSGTGIGLAICQKVVHRYGGRIWVESEGAGQGSRFFFTLPGGADRDKQGATQAEDPARRG